MKFELYNNHIVINLNEMNFMIDTGCPKSFFFEERQEFVDIAINNQTYRLEGDNIHIKSRTDAFVGANIDGFIGMDILSKTGLTIDYKHNEIYFETTEGNICCFLSTGFSDRYITTDLVINGFENNRVFIDTGACYSLVREDLLFPDDMLDEHYYDWNMYLGEFDGNLSNIAIDKKTLGSGSYGHSSKAGILNPRLYQYFDICLNPFELIRNEEILAPNKIISFNFRKKIVYIK